MAVENNELFFEWQNITGQEKGEDRRHSEEMVLREVAEGRKKKMEQEVVQRGFRERDMEEGVREDKGGERGQTAGRS